MPTFGWIPYPDSDWQVDMMYRARGMKILPMADGAAPLSGSIAGAWNEIAAGDILMIAAHGRKYTTESIGWYVNSKLVVWSAAQLAAAIASQLGGNKGLALEYRLLACFGANNITALAESFGERLSKAMTREGLKGTLTAYKGAVGMQGNRGKQQGSSRITCAMSILRHGTTAHGRPTADSGKSWTL